MYLILESGRLKEIDPPLSLDARIVVGIILATGVILVVWGISLLG